MITLQEFDGALKLIENYRLQLQVQLEEKAISNIAISKRTINMQQYTKISLFNALRNYYNYELGIELKWNDLKTMDIDVLKDINYNKLLRYRGFGIIALEKFKNLLELFNVTVIPENEPLKE
jgi:hypothetical protein